MIGSGSVIYGTVMEGHVVEKSPNDYSRCRYGERALTCPTQPRQRREHPCTWGCAGGGCPDYDNSTERSGFPSSTHAPRLQRLPYPSTFTKPTKSMLGCI